MSARHAQRLADLAREAQLTEAQATAALAQMPRPPHAPTFHHVVTDTRPDGARNIFGLMDTEESAECRFDGGEARDCHTRRPETDVFWIQVDAHGEVARIGLGTPGGTIRAPGTHRPTQLRLFAPTAGAAAVALVDGYRVSTSRPIEYTHDAWVWDGRTFSRLSGFQLAQPRESFFGAEVGAVEITADGHGLEATMVACEGACRCRISHDPADEAAQLADLLAHHAAACTASHPSLAIPADLHLVDDDLAARTPHRTRDEAIAARASDLATAWSITSEQATAILAPMSGYEFPSPRFERPLSATLADGTRAFYGVVTQSGFDACVYSERGVTIHDAVRRCAAGTSGDQGARTVLSVRIAPDGSVAETRRGSIDPSASLLAQHLVAEASGDVGYCAELEQSSLTLEGAHHYVQLLQCLHHGASSASTTLVDFDDAGHGGMRLLGDVVAQPAGAEGRQTLTHRRASCTASCPCDPAPLTAAAVSAMIAARTRAGGACTPSDEAVDVH